ncbi:MAG TPA: protein kinase [Patescibacteria group bacterium]|nr:protein kinase [Patescibacteria group bacterium]
MTLVAGTRLGPYEIVDPLGAGGMGEVYRAKDTRLGREVAVKVLPQHLSESPEVRARFEREARTVSSLNHPHICTLHDVGREGSTDYLVMELVDGETLATRIERGAVPVPELLRLGVQIADALDRAHRAGVVHRDLKPANVMLTRSGAKLMDFGLARATGTAGPAGGSGVSMAGMTRSPTLAQPLTSEGSIVGTFQYMSPEQLEGREADARSDLWALGCVLYECATGRRAFTGKSQASLIGAIMNTEPPSIALAAPLIPPGLERLVRACLSKDPDERIQTAHDVRLQLEWIRDAGSQAGVPEPVAAKRKARERIAWALAAIGLAAAALLLVMRLAAPVQKNEPFQGSILPAADTHLVQYASTVIISPDGRNVVFAAARGADTSLWLRPLGSDTASPVPESDLGLSAFWSPDSRSLAYATLDGKLKKISAVGGAPMTICNLKWARGGTWGRKDVIVFAPAPEGPLMSVPASGGAPSPATTLDAARHQTAHRFPSFLPDGEHFLFLALPGGEDGYDTFLGSLHDGSVKKILTADSAAVYAEPGVLLFAKDGKILAQHFDTGRLELSGESAVIADAPAKTDLDAEPVVSASDNGRLVFLRSAVRSTRLAWIDRAGALRGAIPLPAGPWTMADLSPDARHAALMNGPDVWVVDIARAIPTRLVSTFSGEANVVWLGDSRRLAFTSNRSGRAEIYLGSVDATGDPEMVATTDAQFKTIWDVSPDGNMVVFGAVGDRTSWDLWILPMGDKGKPKIYQGEPGTQVNARISPDGRWLAYASGGDSAKLEVYVQSFPVPGRKVRVSVSGGDFPIWTRGGKELLYRTGNAITSVAIGGGAELEPGAPQPLFDLPEGTSGFGATSDGERFLVTAGPNSQRDIRVILNWTSLLKP